MRPFILAIGKGDRFFHAYRDDQALLRDGDIGAGVGEHPIPLEFFDSAGHRLAGVYDARWRLERLVRTTDKPDARHVWKRLQNVIGYMRSYARSHPEKAALFGLSVDELLDLLPPLSPHVDFDAAFPEFAGDQVEGELERNAFADEDWTSSASHNWKHICGG